MKSNIAAMLWWLRTVLLHLWCRAQLPVSRTLIVYVSVDKLKHPMYAWLAAS